MSGLAAAEGRRRPGAGAACGSVARAKSFLAQLHDRWDTLRRVAEYTVQQQQEFLVDGPTALKPLTRAEVAAALGLHESTVSRAIADKYALLPDGTIVPLSRFFGVGGGVDGELRQAARVGRRPDVRPVPGRPAARGRISDRPADRRQASGAARIRLGRRLR